MNLDDKQFPTIARLINKGDVWVEGLDLVGRASDGEVVSLGTVVALEAAEQFLAGASTPDLW